jgi:hypothetical protein
MTECWLGSSDYNGLPREDGNADAQAPGVCFPGASLRWIFERFETGFSAEVIPQHLFGRDRGRMTARRSPSERPEAVHRMVSDRKKREASLGTIRAGSVKPREKSGREKRNHDHLTVPQWDFRQTHLIYSDSHLVQYKSLNQRLPTCRLFKKNPGHVRFLSDQL